MSTVLDIALLVFAVIGMLCVASAMTLLFILVGESRTANRTEPTERIRWFVIRKHPNGTAVIEEHTDESPASAAERLLRGESS